MAEVTVVIPVGPFPSNTRWLGDCLESVYSQTEKVDEILIVSDQAKLDFQHISAPPWTLLNINGRAFSGLELREISTPWLSGIPHAFNFGIADAKNELILMLGSDDWLDPIAVEKLIETYEKNKRQDAYYTYTIKYSDNDEIQDLPCNCAAVTKGLWKLTGGFPPESSIGACDSIFISMMIRHHPKLLVPIALGYPLYNYRRHNESDSGTRPVDYQSAISTVRDVFTRNWKKPTWT